MRKLIPFFISISFLILVSMSLQAQTSKYTNTKNSNQPIVSVKVFPNPATLFFNVNSPEKLSLVRVYNLIGKKVKTFSDAADKTRFDIDDLDKGMYLVQIVNNKGRVIATRRLRVNTP